MAPGNAPDGGLSQRFVAAAEEKSKPESSICSSSIVSARFHAPALWDRPALACRFSA